MMYILWITVMNDAALCESQLKRLLYCSTSSCCNRATIYRAETQSAGTHCFNRMDKIPGHKRDGFLKIVIRGYEKINIQGGSIIVWLYS